MTELDQRLSMLWDGELPEEEARALRARIEAEPEVARRWQRLCSAMEALSELPVAMTPPPLQPRSQSRSQSQERAEPPRRDGSRAISWGLLALAASALLALTLQERAQPGVVLAEGSQWVEGEMDLLAGDVAIEVDGKVWISVEPPDGVERVGGPSSEDAMDKSKWMAALSGAVVTVAVYQGTAVVRAALPGEGEAEPVVVSAGQTHRTAPGRAPQREPGAMTPERQQRIEQLQAQIAELQQQLAEAQFEGAITRGQLAALQGTPSPWPDQVPEAFAPENFRQKLEERLQAIPDAEIAEVDCSEYPCVAAIRYTGPMDDTDHWNEPIGQAVHDWLTEVGGEEMSVSVNTSRFRHDNAEERYVIFGAHQGDRDTDVGKRTEYRIDAMVDELGQQLKDRQP